MNILVSINKSYVKQLNILLNSIAYSNKNEEFSVYVLNKELDDEDFKNLTTNLNLEKFSIMDIKIPKSEIDTFPVIEKRYPIEMYFRLFASEYLPKELDRILYLDSDTIVINNLNELYNMDFEDNYFIAATHIKKVLHKFNEIRLNIKEDEPYINTGVLLINLKELRKINVKEKIIKYVEVNQKKLLLPDQDIITSLFGDKIKLIDGLKYNLGEVAWHMYNVNNPNKKITLKWILKNTVIIHYYGRNKPWNRDYIGSLDCFYKKVLKRIKKDMPKKVLILSCGTGGGHNSAAKAVKQALNQKGIEADFKEYLEITRPKLKDKVNDLYINSTNNEGKVFEYVYNLGKLYQKTKLKSPVYSLNKLNANKLYYYIENNFYDYVVTTHLFAAQALTAIKKEHNIHFIAIATDYVSIPFWEETNPDYFIIPSDKLKSDFIKKGINEEKLIPLGIPVQLEYSMDYDKNIVKKELNLDLNKKYILVLTGSMGFGNISDLISDLVEEIKDCNFIISCGNNNELLQEIQKKYKDSKNVSALAFTQKLNLYIKASDIVLTKPGGLTTTEIATIRKPFKHTMPIPGCENYNAEFFQNLKMSIKCNAKDEVIKNTKRLLIDDDLQKEMVLNQKKYINRNASMDIANFIEKQLKENDK